MNDQSILVKLFLLTLFIGNVSMNFVAEGSGVVGEGREAVGEIPAYGWLSFGPPCTWLDENPTLKEIQHGSTPEQFMARYALYQIEKDHLADLDKHGILDPSEILTGMVWLIGLAAGNKDEWLEKAAQWKLHKGAIPEDRIRIASFRENAAKHYGWLTKARKSNLGGLSASDDTAIAAYLADHLTQAVNPPKKKKVP